MEILLQYLDDLDDFVGMFALTAERIWRAARALAVWFLAVAVLSSGVLLALIQPPLALALVSLLAVGALYRAAVSHTIRAVAAADS